MLPLKIEKHVFAHTTCVPPSCQPEAPKIDFQKHLEPFVDALASAGAKILISTLVVAGFVSKVISAVNVVLFRLMNDPVFHPLDPSFKNETLANFEANVPLLLKRIEALPLKFQVDSLMTPDMLDFKDLVEKTHETRKKLELYRKVLAVRQYRLAIEKDIQLVLDQYEALSTKLDDYCSQEGPKLVQKFGGALDFFTKGGLAPLGPIRDQLVVTWQALDYSIREHFPRIALYKASSLQSSLMDIKDKVKAMEASATVQQFVGEGKPLKLQNKTNTCYLDSVLNMYFSVEAICKDLAAPIEEPKPFKPADPSNPHYEEVKKWQEEQFQALKAAYPKKLALQQDLVKFLNVQKANQHENFSLMDYILFLRSGGPDNAGLRQRIFDSKLHPELREQIYSQKDAENVAALFMQLFLPSWRLMIQRKKCSEVYPAVEFVNKPEPIAVLQIELPVKEVPVEGKAESILVKSAESVKGDEPKTDKSAEPKAEGTTTADKEKKSLVLAKPEVKKEPKFDKVEDLIKGYLTKEHIVDQPVDFEPAGGFGLNYESGQLELVVDVIASGDIEVAKSTVKSVPKQKLKEYDTWITLKNLPPVITMQFKRFARVWDPIKKEVVSVKNDQAVILPKDRIIDLAQFYEGPEKSAKYRYKGIVRHLGGTLESGHYVADVEMQGKFYHCDDLSSDGYKEISEMDFYSIKDAYLMVLERIQEPAEMMQKN